MIHIYRFLKLADRNRLITPSAQQPFLALMCLLARQVSRDSLWGRRGTRVTVMTLNDVTQGCLHGPTYLHVMQTGTLWKETRLCCRCWLKIAF